MNPSRDLRNRALAFGHGAWANCAQALCAGLGPERMTSYRTANGALMRLELPA